MLTIDGSFGEGGGQILRSSLALSMKTGQAFRIENIRAGRKKPGLRHQHLAAVRAAVEVCGGKAGGDALRSQTLTFEPGPVRGGEYTFAVGTAGSATLVLQTVLPALITAAAPSTVTLRGGTHNPWAPPFDFLDRALLPLLNRMGPTISAELARPGFYPAGGGEFTVSIAPAPKLRALEILARGEIIARRAKAVLARLPEHIAERELRKVERRLGWAAKDLRVEATGKTAGPGNVLCLEVESENMTEVFTGFGRVGVPAEAVAERAIQQVEQYLAAGVPVGEYLADQLLVPMALAGGRFRTLPPTRHAETNIEVIEQFLSVDVTLTQIQEKVWEFHLAPGG